MKILLDNGHGEDTAGKRSPDGLFREFWFAREVVQLTAFFLRHRGYDVECIVPELTDVPLSERVRRVNAWCNGLGSENVVLLSVHCNAAGNGSQWMHATGWSAYTSKGQTQSDALATLLYNEAEKNFQGLTIRRDLSDGDPDWEESFYILRKTKCAAVLTENFFQDCKKDVEYLESIEGRDAIVKTHVDAIIKYVEQYG